MIKSKDVKVIFKELLEEKTIPFSAKKKIIQDYKNKMLMLTEYNTK